jgi:sulfur-oxidizing protein SoxY
MIKAGFKNLGAIGLVAMMSVQAAAQDVWSDLRPELFDDRAIAPAGDVVAIAAPYRSMNELHEPLGVSVQAPAGALIQSVSLIIDNNPMPVSAVFEMARPHTAFGFSIDMRLNGSTPVRVVVETDAGELYMAERFVKTAGVGACAAPPGTDPIVARETLGQMQLALVEPAPVEPLAQIVAISDSPRQSLAIGSRAQLSISHPSHSGMQMDQISLLYIPARYIHQVEVSADDGPVFTMTGSISLSENPSLTFDVPLGTSLLNVRLIQSDGAEFGQMFPLIQG